MQEITHYWSEIWQTLDIISQKYPFFFVIIFVVICFAVRKPLANLILNIVKKSAQQARIDISSEILETLKRPLHLISLVFAILGSLEILQITGADADVWKSLAQSLITLSLFWMIYSLLPPLTNKIPGIEKLFGKALVGWLVRTFRVITTLLALATILELWGINVAHILAGMGLFGVAVALGAQDLFKNLIAGLLILSEKRMEEGDWIKVDGVIEGTVEQIGFRSTRIRRFDKAPTLVPNTALADRAVTNFSGMTYRRIAWTIGVKYTTTVDQLRAIRDNIESYLLDSSDFVSPPDAVCFVRIDRFSDSSIDIMIYCFTRTTDWGEWLALKEQFAYKIKQIVSAAGTDFAFPSQSLYLHAADMEKMEQLPDLLLPQKNLETTT